MDGYIDDFINYLSVERGLAANTLLAYRRDLLKYQQFLEDRKIDSFAGVQRDHVTEYIFDQKDRGLQATSIARNLAAIKMFHRFLVREGLVKSDPTHLVDTPKLWQRVPEVLSQAEIESMIQFAQDHEVILQLIELIETGSVFVKTHFISLESLERQLAARARKIKTRPMQARKQYFLAKGIVEVVRSQHNIEFCQHCNKIRVTSDGYLKPCLMRDDNLVSIEEVGSEAGLGLAVERRRPFYG